jgi:hypothetical protein
LRHVPAGNYPPFWNTNDSEQPLWLPDRRGWKIFELSHFSGDGQIGIGLFDNNAQQSTRSGLEKVVTRERRDNHATFVSEAGLQLKYQVMDGLAVKAGYEARGSPALLWRPDRSRKPLQLSLCMHLQSNSGQVCLFGGFTAGLEYLF